MSQTKEVNSLDELFIEIQKDMDAIVRGTSSEVSDRMIMKAPKESGALAASIDLQINTEVVSFDKSQVDYSSTAQNNRTKALQAKAGDEINIIVGAPYGQVIEEGDANHKPHGFIASTGNELDAINQAVLLNFDRYRDK